MGSRLYLLCHLTFTSLRRGKATFQAGSEVWQGSGIHCVWVQGEDGECSFHEEVHPCGQNHQAHPDTGVSCLHCRRILTPAQPRQHELGYCQGEFPRGRWTWESLSQGSPTSRPRTSTGLWSIRNRAAQQEVSCKMPNFHTCSPTLPSPNTLTHPSLMIFIFLNFVWQNTEL